jgi:hypothetical protein
MPDEGFVVNNPEHLDAQRPGYGMYDTQDNCWLGDETGPRVFTIEDSAKANGMPHRLMAQIAAQMVEVQLGYTPGRVQVREYDVKNLRLRDQVETQCTPLEALIKLESAGAKVETPIEIELESGE